MDLFQAVILALIQGLTEFLPISSSAHLILPKEVFGWPDQGLAFDVAVHVGTLVAVLLYFKRDIGAISLGGIKTLGGHDSKEGRLAWFLILATIPAALAGLVFEDFIETQLRDPRVIAYATLVGAILLVIADRLKKNQLSIADLTWKTALLIGIAQATALIPGTSRSGITLTAALLIGLTPAESAKFSFLLSIPIIALSGGWKALQLAETTDAPLGLIAVATVISAVSAYFCIHYFLKLIQSVGLMPFVIYRLALGVALLTFF